MQHLGAEAGRAVEAGERLDLVGREAGLFLELAAGALERRLARVDQTGGQLEHGLVHRRPPLPHQQDAALGVDGDHGRARRVLDDFAQPHAAVGLQQVLEAQRHDAASVDFPLATGHRIRRRL